VEHRAGQQPASSALIPNRIAIIVTSEVLKTGPVISGNIMEILIVDHDGNYSPNPAMQAAAR
jgi:hypothetical protein